MSTEFTGCGIDVPQIFPNLCTVCIKDCYLKGNVNKPLFEVPDPNRDDGDLMLDSDEDDGFGCPGCSSKSITTTDDGAELPQGNFHCRDCGHEWSPITLDGTEGQDRESYGDDQDRDSYVEDLEWKTKFAEREAEQEQAAHEAKAEIRFGDVEGLLLSQFPHPGQFENTIYRPSARELCEALPDYRATLDGDQLVLERDLGGGSTVIVYTSIKVGQIAGGTSDDSIRVVRRDVTERGTFHHKENQHWITRSVPKEADTPEQAAAHLAGKVTEMVVRFTGTCPKCGGVTIKCKGSIKGRHWWRCLEGCR